MSHAKEPPSLPEVIVDEAGNSPAWLPLVGLGLLALAALLIAVHQAIGSAEDAKPQPAPAAQEAARAPEAAAPSAPSQVPAAAPAE
jgi:hypothetical protein